ncbi:MAG TPA: glycosyltransferase family A protein, partial [Myxococcota bacterium]|nr:glycosyltransferase family A protein [Myxococcota bacterium]
PEWASACPERFGRPPLDPDALRRAREALLAELRQAAADGSVFGLGGPELVGFAQAAGDLLRGERLVFLDGVDVDDPPPDLPLAQHQRVTREVAAALGVTWPEPVPQRVSVIIITRDRAPLLRRALAALRDQRRAPDEVVVVDNGSSDDTPEVIREAAAWLPIVHVFEPIAGIPRARNAGAGAATGDLLCYTDDDATADPGWLAAIEDRFQRDPRIGLVGGETLPDDRQTGIIARFFREYMGSEVAP